eukprot:TRINITY_DN503_c0_g1_i3.p3 TRINITY_DN503_c0_g1~~TRINITY_DN503_c0_g1_i3.p3  ORF type:complete len:109 (-),score=0.95 TRINITY_DN503_c0_g1_i3:276-602(-)
MIRVAIFDAGPSGSRVHIYQWHHRRNAKLRTRSSRRYLPRRSGVSTSGQVSAPTAQSPEALLPPSSIFDSAFMLIPAFTSSENVSVSVFAASGMRVMEHQHRFHQQRS